MQLLRFNRSRIAWVTLLALAVLGIPLMVIGGASGAAVNAVPLGTAGNFVVLSGTGITDIPTSSLKGDVGVSAATGASITGLTCAEVKGSIFTVDAFGPLPCRKTNPGGLTVAKNALTAAYTNAAGRSAGTTFVAADNQLGGHVLNPGVYRFGHATTANLIGNVTLSGDASSVWIFQATSDLVTDGSSTVTLQGGAQACNVFWQVGSSAILGGSSSLKGTVIAGTSITVGTGVTIAGRVLAQALVTLDSDTITRSACTSSSGSPPAREIYCDPSGKAYDLLVGQDKDPPYDKLGLVPAYVDPVTGAKTCTFPTAVVTTPTTTTTTTTTPTAPTPKPVKKPAVKKPARHRVAAAKKTKVTHIVVRTPPKPARHGFGLTG